ncbi:AbrB/MazE/SpoVT family DNA-binding domain-containing protein [Lentibacillus sp. CBA3610]|uniref:AbrB/MazE/SpoVT family DNA-binding domain-containing protein n=1 Tax=Lentibacillus sp. CBA3610 TaxID=2518176 RepID=UPI0015962100|nr:AbrB/MazE/SpoVT family DNA-binding domain-containing protein [Lentibacillus sp. CBA3610]QKY71383.1 AbrB/MazE/SpoVT family DNA-binding domain-containing protein [Lentibacillus sp. CBA3610]
MSTTAQKWGNSIGVRIPQKIAKKYNIVNGSELEISEDNQGIILKPVSKEPSLEELMAGITKENQHEEINWGKPEGNEVW